MASLLHHGTKEYEDTLVLRYEVLRKPLGLSYDPRELAEEDDSFHIATRFEGKVLACLVLKPLDERYIKMRQLAVRESSQGKGFGRELVNHAESFAKERGYAEIVLHARETALGFYEKLGYQAEGARFVEVGLPHFLMQKRL